ncbi:hypothetical protein [Ruminococcus sp.]|uniref:hypothetical protein n=1 Tax=Ruminococcus sp. TaxID=41978 RepID=UPI0025E3C10C|nr:hypothetical protein [Ruminococcus sp.]
MFYVEKLLLVQDKPQVILAAVLYLFSNLKAHHDCIFEFKAYIKAVVLVFMNRDLADEKLHTYMITSFALRYTDKEL